MHRNYHRLLLHDVRACDFRRCLEHILELARQEQANPTRPQVGHLILLEPADHMLPICVRHKREIFLAIYNRPQHLIDPDTLPLLWANITPSPACKASCTGHCSGVLAVEVCLSPRFPMLPFDVWTQIADDLQLDCCTLAEVPDIWSPFCSRVAEPAATLAAEVATGAAAAFPYLMDFESDAVWLKNKMSAEPDPSQYDQFYDGWMHKYQATHDGHYPRDTARHFPRLADRLQREILAGRKAATSAAAANG